jgi:hypothetical protein
VKVPWSPAVRATTLLAVIVVSCASGATGAAGALSKTLRCDDSLKTAFRADALTNVIAVMAFKKGDSLGSPVPGMPVTPSAASDLCLVKLIVGPGNPGPADAPSTSRGIGIEVWLPAPVNWNERVHNVGGLGGFDGGAHSSPTTIGWPYAAVTAGTEGAVSASTDSGHGQTNGSWGINPDGTLNRALWTDYAHRAMHEMAVKTRALATAYYGRPPRFSYYEGASTGGRHGYRLAQQHPEDYDGIVANLPALNWAAVGTANMYRSLVVERDLAGVPLTEDQQDLVSNAAIHDCDVVGGQHLGYIMDNAACHYDPSQDPNVLCKADGGSNTTAACVTRVQANAVNKFWYGLTSDGSVPSPAVDNGVAAVLKDKHRWYGLMRGTSLYNVYFTKRDPVMSKLLKASAGSGGVGADMVALELQNPTLAGPQFKNASGDGQSLWKLLSYEQLANGFDRGVALDAVFGHLASDDPDLSAFKARKGKFLSWQGWNDEAIPVQGTIRYYDRVIEKMGGVGNVQSFFKLYLVPGGGHMSPQGTSNSDAHPPAVAPGQFYKLMVDWVEKGIEPGRVEIQSPAATPIRITQPICPYPQRAMYIGGDPNVTTSFTCS